jgi:hypothetical protein
LPDQPDLDDRLKALVASGVISWDGRQLGRIEPPATNKGKKLASDILIESRK